MATKRISDKAIVAQAIVYARALEAGQQTQAAILAQELVIMARMRDRWDQGQHERHQAQEAAYQAHTAQKWAEHHAQSEEAVSAASEAVKAGTAHPGDRGLLPARESMVLTSLHRRPQLVRSAGVDQEAFDRLLRHGFVKVQSSPAGDAYVPATPGQD